MTIPSKYTELTEEKEAFYETPEGKAVLEATGEEQQKAWELYKKIKAEEEQEAYQEGKYEKKKYFDEGGVWIPRIVTFLILMLLFWLIGNVETYYDNALFCENRIC
jgi:hypothetical protein